MASSTRSALRLNSLSAISLIFHWPLSSCFQSRRTALRAVSLPSLPVRLLVATAQSRAQHSSCEREVGSLFGQFGQVSGLFSFSGGFGNNSNWVTEAAPWRIDVPTQSEPVSPPPIRRTCLRFAESGR